MKYQQNQNNTATAAFGQEEMAQIIGGDKCKGLALACGGGIAITLLTQGLGAIMFGPSTGALCYAAYRC